MTALPLWQRDATFMRVWEEIAGHTLVDVHRCWVLWQLACRTPQDGTPMAEVGVYKGGTARLLASVEPSRRVILFDTFQGLPQPGPQDLHRKGDFDRTSLSQVRAFVGHELRVVIVPGLFPQTAALYQNLAFSLVHVDCDLYQSVADCCRFFWPRLLPGGMMVFDDYGFASCPGATKAVDEFFAGTADRPIYLPTGQAVAVKVCNDWRTSI